MMRELSNQSEGQAFRYVLACEELRLSIEFALRPGELGRIGSAPDLEISIPLVGLPEEACSLSMDPEGVLWLDRVDQESPVKLNTPTYLRIGSHRFLITEEVEEARGAAELGGPGRNSGTMTMGSKVLAVCGVLALVAAGILVASGFLERNGAGEAREVGTEILPVEVGSESGEQPAEEGHVAAIHKESDKRGDPASDGAGIAATALEPNEQASKQSDRLDLEGLAKRVGPCVFSIEVLNQAGDQVNSGTGFSVSDDGLVVTNYHVVEPGTSFVLVTDQGAKFEGARLLVTESKDDLAVLKIEAKGLPWLPIAPSSDVPVGKRVAVYGSPAGLAGSLSEGIVSAPLRDTSSAFPSGELPNGGVLLQTNAEVSPGSSGSPVFDQEGAVLGVMTLASAAWAQGLNFAIPVEPLKRLIERASNSHEGSLTSLDLPPWEEERNPLTPDGQFLDDREYRKLRREMERANWIEALKFARGLVDKYPRSAVAFIHQAHCMSMLRLDRQAELSSVKAVEIDPKSHAGWSCLGVALAKQQRYEEALVAYETSIAIDPESVWSWDNILSVSIALGNWGKAGNALDTLRQLDPKQAKARAEVFSRFSIPDPVLKASINRALSEVVGSGVSEGRAFKVRGVATKDSLTVRAGPGVGFPKVTSLPNGAQVFVVGEPTMNGRTEWLPIESGHFSGWASSRYLQPAD